MALITGVIFPCRSFSVSGLTCYKMNVAFWYNLLVSMCADLEKYSAFTETGATQTMKTNQMAELKQSIPTFSNPANQMPGTKQ